MKKIVLSFIMMSLYTSLYAESESKFLFGGGVNALLVDKKTFSVSVVDEVTGGCLPKPKKLQESVEKSLKKHGFKIVDNNDNPFIPEVIISTLGFRINGMCAVQMSMDIYFPVQVVVPVAVNVQGGNKTYVRYCYDVGAYIANYRRKDMQGKLQKIASKFTDRIYMRIAKSKDDMFTKFPTIREEMEKKSN